MLELRYYCNTDGNSPFEKWFVALDASARARVTVALARLEQGNTLSLKGVGEEVIESCIDQGTGYRVDLGRDGEALVLLLTGGTQTRQQRDIEVARAIWADYRRRK